MATKKDMRRADLSTSSRTTIRSRPNHFLVIPYVEPVADKEETDMAGTDRLGGNSS